jgi:hypothetical protein
MVVKKVVKRGYEAVVMTADELVDEMVDLMDY